MQSIQKCGLEHCKVAKYIDIALLRSCRKDWWIEMKNVQISQELFFLLVRYFLIGQEETEPEIAKALEKKMDAFLLFYFLPLVPFRRAIAREREALEW